MLTHAQRAEVDDLVRRLLAAVNPDEKAHKFVGVSLTQKVALGDGKRYTAKIVLQPPEHFYVRYEPIEGAGKAQVMASHAGKGWRHFDGKVEDLDDGKHEEIKNLLHRMELVFMPSCLKEKAKKLTLLGEAKVENRPAVRLRVEEEGYRPCTLFFDKESLLLVKLETEATRLVQMTTKVESYEIFYSGHKKVDGYTRPMTIRVHYPDASADRFEETTVQIHLDKLPEKVFARP
jgi:hypothetical protein